MRPSARAQSWWWPLGSALGVGLLAVTALTPARLATGGLAILVVFALVAVVASRLATEDWARDTSQPTDALASALMDIAVVGTAAVALHTWTPIGWSWTTPTLWAFAGCLGLLGYRVGLFALAGFGLLATAAAAQVWQAVPWGLLEPSAAAPADWLPTAVSMGALAGWAVGQWEHVPHAEPNRWGVPRIATGLSILAALFGALLVSADWEANLGARHGTLAALGMMSAAGLGVLSIATRASSRSGRIAYVVAGVFGWLWFESVGTDTWWSAQLPLLVAGACAVRFVTTRHAVWAIAAVVPAGAVLYASPGIPGYVASGFAFAVPFILAVWIGGTRAILVRST